VYLNRVSASLSELPECAESGRLAGGQPGRLLIPHLVTEEPLVQDGQVPPYLRKESSREKRRFDMSSVSADFEILKSAKF
jgi:hypothetical protein